MTLTQKQEAFVVKYIECDNASEAYRHAYNTQNMLPKTIRDSASELLNSPGVTPVIEELRAAIEEKVLGKLVIDKTFLTEGIMRNIECAEHQGDNNVALKGYDMLGKMYDLNEDKQNDRLVSDRQRASLLENFKARLLDVTPEEEE